MTGIAYVRSACVNDEQIARQIAQVKESAAMENIELVEIIERNGLNGFRSKRELKKILKEIKDKKADVLIVADLTRITRNMLLLFEFQESLRKENISILVSSGGIDNESIKNNLQYFGYSR